MKTGYIFVSQEHGAFSPDGKVDITQAKADAHNHKLAADELESMKATGKALLYLFEGQLCPDGFKRTFVGSWNGDYKWPVGNVNTSHNNWGAKRTDVWFNGPDGAVWHGVNLGDNQICRCSRNKA